MSEKIKGKKKRIMSERIKGILIGFTIATIFACGSVFATNFHTIQVTYDNIKIFVDGQEVVPKDANGQTVEPFIYNGTTYLPIRAIGSALGKEVNWDGVEKVVYLGAVPGEGENWFDECEPYQYKFGEEYRLEDNKYFTMSGQKYTDGFVLRSSSSNSNNTGLALFNLNGQYNSLSFTVGHIDGEGLYPATLNVYIDGIIAYTKELDSHDVAQNVTIPLNGALQMKIEVLQPKNASGTYWGFSQGKFE